jgi:hypothetical protein
VKNLVRYWYASSYLGIKFLLYTWYGIQITVAPTLDQELRDNHPKMHGTRYLTTSDAITLQLDQILLDPSGNNGPDMWTQPGYIVAETVISKVQDLYRNRLTLPSNIIDIEYPDPYGPNEDTEYLPIKVPDDMAPKAGIRVPNQRENSSHTRTSNP